MSLWPGNKRNLTAPIGLTAGNGSTFHRLTNNRIRIRTRYVKVRREQVFWKISRINLLLLAVCT